MKYMLLIYHEEQDWHGRTEPEHQAIYHEYRELIQELQTDGKYLAGDQLQPATTASSVRVRNGNQMVTDGPFAETREQLGGWEFLRTPMPTGLGSTLPGFRELHIMRDLKKRLAEIVSQVQPDLLHAHSPVLNALPAIQVGREYGIPVVYEIRAFWEDANLSAKRFAKPNLRYRVARRLETYAMQRADALVTICAGLSADIAARGIPTEKIAVVPNAVDRATFTGPAPPDEQLAAKLGVRGKTVIGFFGSFYFYEGLHVLLRALPDLRRCRPDIAVLLVGGGPEEGNLRELVIELGIADAVVFAGRVPQTALEYPIQPQALALRKVLGEYPMLAIMDVRERRCTPPRHARRNEIVGKYNRIPRFNNIIIRRLLDEPRPHAAIDARIFFAMDERLRFSPAHEIRIEALERRVGQSDPRTRLDNAGYQIGNGRFETRGLTVTDTEQGNLHIHWISMGAVRSLAVHGF